MRRLLCLALAVLFGSCLRLPAARSVAADYTPPEARGELVSAGGVLRYLDGDSTYALESVAGAQPYRIVTTGQPTLVTTANEQLAVVTWALGAQATAYPDLYPLVVQPPLISLAGLPTREYEYLGPVLLLGTDGTAVWRHDHAIMLWPPVPPAEAAAAYLVLPDARAQITGNLLFPLGTEPRLVAVEAATGDEQWRAALDPPAAVAGAELWHLTAEHGLVCLQYDYQAFEFVIFRRGDGALTERFRLAGQPATRLAYPGGFDDPLPLEFDGHRVGITVVNTRGGAERWWFDLTAGTCEPVACDLPPRGFSEENPLSIGGEGPPKLSAPPFPQRLLPTASGDSWRIEALVDAGGRVLVVTDEACHWLTPDSGTR